MNRSSGFPREGERTVMGCEEYQLAVLTKGSRACVDTDDVNAL